MNYATAIQFCERIGYRDVARRLTADTNKAVAEILLRKRLLDEDVTDYPIEDIAACDQLIELINSLIQSASARMNNILCKKVCLPLSQEVFEENLILIEYCIHIANSYGNLPTVDANARVLANESLKQLELLTLVIDGRPHNLPSAFSDDEDDIMPSCNSQSNQIEMPAHHLMQVHRAVAIIDGKIKYAQPTDITHLQKVLGIVIRFNEQKMTAVVQTNDIAAISGFAGGLIFFTDDGILTTTPPINATFIQSIGFGLNGQKIQVEIGAAIRNDS